MNYRRQFVSCIVLGIVLIASNAFGQAAMFDNGGFEANSFVEGGLQDVDHSASPGNIDFWQYTSAVSPMAALFRGGSIYAPRSGDYMLGLGSTPSGFPNSALTGQAETIVAGFAINQAYEWTFWYAPGYVIDTSSGSNQYLFGSELGATTTAQIEASIIGVDTTFVSSVPTAQQAPTPVAADWHQASLAFVAPATELTFSLAVIPDGSTNPGALVGYYFFDDLALQVVPKLILGDVNCDGEVNLLDIAPFVDAISTGTFIEKADINQDGFVNLLDIGPFVDLLSGK